MKKIYRQSDIFHQIHIYLHLIIFIVSTFFLTYNYISNPEDLYGGYGFLIFAILFVVLPELLRFISLQHQNIYIKGSLIYMHGFWFGLPEFMFQLFAKIDVKDIESIDIIWSNRNSRGGSMYYPGYSPPALPYLTFKSTKYVKRKIRMFIAGMSCKTLTKLINDIKKLMIENNNFNKIEDTDILITRYVEKSSIKKAIYKKYLKRDD